MLESESVIQHYGTKGMKWGVRHDPGHVGEAAKTKKIAKLDKKFERAAFSTKTFWKVYDAAAPEINRSIAEINNKPAYVKAANSGILLNDDHPTTKAYTKEIQKAYVDGLNKAADAQGSNASGTKKLTLYTYSNSDRWDLGLEDITHADGLVELKVVKNSVGLIESITAAEPMSHSDSIQHYGVKGMKWGRRKEDNAGPVQIETRQKTPGSRVKIKATKGGGLGPAQDAIDAKRIRQTAKKSGPNALSNKELQALVTRLNLERQYAQLTPADQGAIKLGALYAKKLSGLGRATNEAVQYANSPAGKLIKTRLAGG